MLFCIQYVDSLRNESIDSLAPPARVPQCRNSKCLSSFGFRGFLLRFFSQYQTDVRRSFHVQRIEV